MFYHDAGSQGHAHDTHKCTHSHATVHTWHTKASTHTYIQIHRWTHTQTHTCTFMHTHRHISAHRHTHTHTPHTYINTCTHTYTHTHAQRMHTHRPIPFFTAGAGPRSCHSERRKNEKREAVWMGCRERIQEFGADQSSGVLILYVMPKTAPLFGIFCWWIKDWKDLLWGLDIGRILFHGVDFKPWKTDF